MTFGHPTQTNYLPIIWDKVLNNRANKNKILAITFKPQFLRDHKFIRNLQQ